MLLGCSEKGFHMMLLPVSRKVNAKFQGIHQNIHSSIYALHSVYIFLYMYLSIFVCNMPMFVFRYVDMHVGIFV
jgi:hypothetical protein